MLLLMKKYNIDKKIAMRRKTVLRSLITGDICLILGSTKVIGEDINKSIVSIL